MGQVSHVLSSCPSWSTVLLQGATLDVSCSEHCQEHSADSHAATTGWALLKGHREPRGPDLNDEGGISAEVRLQYSRAWTIERVQCTENRKIEGPFSWPCAAHELDSRG